MCAIFKKFVLELELNCVCRRYSATFHLLIFWFVVCCHWRRTMDWKRYSYKYCWPEFSWIWWWFLVNRQSNSYLYLGALGISMKCKMLNILRNFLVRNELDAKHILMWFFSIDFWRACGGWGCGSCLHDDRVWLLVLVLWPLFISPTCEMWPFPWCDFV